MHSVVKPRPDRFLFSSNSIHNLLQAVLVLCLCQPTAVLAREPDVTPEEVGLSSERLARFAVATLTLVEEGRLSLVEPISKYIPEFADVKVLAGGTADAPELEDPNSAPTVECQRESGRPKG